MNDAGNGKRNRFGWQRSAVSGLMVLAIFLSSAAGVTLLPKPAQANLPVADSTLIAGETSKAILSTIKDNLIEGVVMALANGVNYFTTQLAYQLAMSLSTDCPGQKPCWETMSFGQMVANAGKGAIGEAVGTMSEASGLKDLGFDLCDPSATMTLKIQMGLLSIVEPPKPKCEFNDIVRNWKEAANSMSWSELKGHNWVQFEPGNSPLAVAYEVNREISIRIRKAETESFSERLENAAAGGGFSALSDPVSKRVTAPASYIKGEFDRMRANASGEEAKEQQKAVTAGSIAKGTVANIVSNTVQTFGSTLLAVSWNNLVRGLLSPKDAIQSQPEVVLSLEGVINPSSSQVGKAIRSRYTMPPIRESGSFDPINDFVACPGVSRGPLHCVMDSQFAAAVRLASGGSSGLTVREAVDKGFLHGDWPLISAGDTSRNTQDWCHTVGYCEGNLKKLRAARILPIGWEVAASRSPIGNRAVTLNEAINRFSDCNDRGEADSGHPWCHLIDPDWVLKMPTTQCRALAYSAHLESPDGPNRYQTCVDPVSCLREDDFGACIGGWGYCTQERNVWRFDADPCPEQFNSCRQLRPLAGGNPISLLMNTVDHGSCDSGNAGCAEYSTRQNVATCTLNQTCNSDEGCLCVNNSDRCSLALGERYCMTVAGEFCDYFENTSRRFSECASGDGCQCTVIRQCRVEKGSNFCTTAVGDSVNPADDWLSSSPVFLTGQAKSCSTNDAGCSELIRLDYGQSLNLVKNPGFTETVDGDGDGVSDHAAHWTPFGGKVGFSSYSGEVTDGRALVLSEVGSGTCSLTETCYGDRGCPCTDDSTGRMCLVPFGKMSCAWTQKFMQAGIPVREGQTYTVSASFFPRHHNVGVRGSVPRVKAGMKVTFRDALGRAVSLGSGTLAVNKATDGEGYTCSRDGNSVVADVDYDKGEIRVACSFSVSRSGGYPISTADLSLYAADGTIENYVDDVQLEEGPLTAFHEGYGSASRRDYLKAPPEWLGCRGESTDPEACGSFARVCRENEVGCRAYTPMNGDPTVPGVVTDADRCPAECVGYETYKQESSEFEGSDEFPVYFIPETARSCSATDVGCSEFTDEETEAVSQYSRLRMCQKPGVEEKTFYTWEGSDTAGYQLKTWRLMVQSDGAPCTKLNLGNPEQCQISTAFSCGSGDLLTNLDCREFTDTDGVKFYRLQSRTISVSDGCRRLRLTRPPMTATATLEKQARDCTDTNGVWDAAKGSCTYFALPEESRSCPVEANGCRAYKGNTAANTRQVLFEDYESGLGQTWISVDVPAGSVSSESVTAGGHSVRISGSGGGTSFAFTDRLFHDRLYSVSFWAKGQGKVSVGLVREDAYPSSPCSIDAASCDDGGRNCRCLTEGGHYCIRDSGSVNPTCSQGTAGGDGILFSDGVSLTGDWQEYVLGPVSPSSASFDYRWGTGLVSLSFFTGSGSQAFIDNVVFREVRDSLTVVRGSWKTPASCDRSVSGAYSPQEMLGCREYSDDLGQEAYLRSFSSLCREGSVGCGAYSQTNQNSEIWPKTYQAVCDLGTKCTASMAAGGTACRCDYDLKHPAAPSGVPHYLADACRVPIGESTCRFTLDGSDTFRNRSEYPDIIEVPADRRLYLVADAGSSCSASAAGCQAYGKPVESNEGVCRHDSACPSAAGCWCDGAAQGSSNGCLIDQGQRECVFASEFPMVTAWKTVAFQVDPERYGEISCRESDVGCRAYATDERTYYLKDPGDRVCEYRESATYQGKTYSGWFRKSESGAVLPCYPELVRDGSVFSVYRNADVSCSLDRRCESDAGCPCYLDDGSTLACTVVRGNTSCGYAGWAGICESRYDRCEEFVDPSSTSALNPEGQPYYYLMNSKLDTSSCSGTVNLKEGCVLFDQTSDKRRLFSSSASYARSQVEGGGGAATVSAVSCGSPGRSDYCERRCFRYVGGTCEDDPQKACFQDSDCSGKCQGQEAYGIGCRDDGDCDSDSGERCVADAREWGTGGLENPAANAVPPADSRTDSLNRNFTRNDSNTVIKVRPDRECGRWLECSQYEVSWDDQSNKWRRVCTDFGTCIDNQSSGTAFECTLWDEPEKRKLDLQTYTGRDIGWNGMDYSGYSIFGKFPSQYIYPVDINRGLCRLLTDHGVFDPPGADTARYCFNSADCGNTSTLYCGPALSGVCVAPNANVEPRPCECDTGGLSAAERAAVTCPVGQFCTCSDMGTMRYGIVHDPKYCGGVRGASSTGYCGGDRANETCETSEECPEGLSCIPVNDSDCSSDPSSCPEGISCQAVPCNSDSDCPVEIGGTERGSCIRNHCYLSYEGGPLEIGNRLSSASCRAYPEKDSPFGATVLDGGNDAYRNGQAVKKVSAFRETNVCTQNNDCDCFYTKVRYGEGGGSDRYFSYVIGDSKPPYSPYYGSELVGYCSGGRWDGLGCAETDLGSNFVSRKDCEEEGGKCAMPTEVVRSYGWPGFCIDYDSALTVNNDRGLYGCNLWLPVDQLAGMPSQWNQFREAGFNPPEGVTQLNYCTESNGSGGNGRISLLSSDWRVWVYDNDNWGRDEDTRGDGEWNEGGYQSAEYDIAPMDSNTEGTPVNYVKFLLDSHDNVSDQHIANYSVMKFPSSAVYRDMVAGIRIEFKNLNTNNPVQNYMYLYPDSRGRFMNYWDWKVKDDDRDMVEVRTYGLPDTSLPEDSGVMGKVMSGIDTLVGGCSGAHCTDLFLRHYPSDGKAPLKAYCDDYNDNENFVGAQALFDENDRLYSIDIVLCGNQQKGSYSVTVNDIVIFTRKNCTEIANVHDGKRSGSKDFVSAPFTDRLYRLSVGAGESAYDPGWGYFGETGRPDLDKKDISPLGRTNPAGIVESPDSLLLRNFPPDYPVPIFGTEGGTNFTKLELTCADETCVPFNLDWNADLPQVAGRDMGISNLMRLFARVFNTYEWQRVDRKRAYVSSGSQDDIRTSPTTNGGTHPPKVASVDTGNCQGDACVEGGGSLGDGRISVNGQIDTIESDQAGRFKASIQFYAWADSDRMPIRRKIIDFYGGAYDSPTTGNDVSAATVTWGWFKNHRGMADIDGDGLPAPLCGPSAEYGDPYDWGLQYNACDSRYFEEVRTYTCNDALLNDFRDCGEGVYPCSDGDTCVYRPRVQVMDNWRSCSGFCPGGTAGDHCMDNDLTGPESGPAGGESECSISADVKRPFEYWDGLNSGPNADIEPWIWFGGEIRVKAP
ncbi:hypothetical protein JW899_02315 [Candidatus Uhrbacteria bacterium]|nr:hypothetical protein [Candidatus Uhrbacteria bacterium]